MLNEKTYFDFSVQHVGVRDLVFVPKTPFHTLKSKDAILEIEAIGYSPDPITRFDPLVYVCYPFRRSDNSY